MKNENLAYKPTDIQKKKYTNLATKLVKTLRELGYSWEEVEEEARKAVNKYLRSLTCDENTFLNFWDRLELTEKIAKLKNDEAR